MSNVIRWQSFTNMNYLHMNSLYFFQIALFSSIICKMPSNKAYSRCKAAVTTCPMITCKRCAGVLTTLQLWFTWQIHKQLMFWKERRNLTVLLGISLKFVNLKRFVNCYYFINEMYSSNSYLNISFLDVFWHWFYWLLTFHVLFSVILRPSGWFVCCEQWTFHHDLWLQQST